MRTFWNTKNGLRAIDEWQPNCWVQVTCPTPEDTRFLEDTLGIPDYYISDIADTDERARYDIDEGWILIILLQPPHGEIQESRTVQISLLFLNTLFYPRFFVVLSLLLNSLFLRVRKEC